MKSTVLTDEAVRISKLPVHEPQKGGGGDQRNGVCPAV